MEGLVKSFKDMATIIGGQLAQAWYRFKQGLGVVWDIIVQIAKGVATVFTAVVDSIGAVIGATFKNIGDNFKGLFGKEGLSFEAGAAAFQGLIKDFTVLFTKAAYDFGIIVLKLNSFADTLKNAIITAGAHF